MKGTSLLIAILVATAFILTSCESDGDNLYQMQTSAPTTPGMFNYEATPTPFSAPTFTFTAAPSPTATPMLAPKPTTTPTPNPTPTPIARMGDTVPEVGGGSNQQLSLKLLSWRGSDLAIVGPYSGGDYYTFTVKTGMIFIILYYTFTNNWDREQSTPYINAGELRTSKGYYEVWSPPSGIYSTEYSPRKATENEINTLGGDSGAYIKLLPGESVSGRVVFEIPQEAIPYDAQFSHVPLKILFIE